MERPASELADVRRLNNTDPDKTKTKTKERGKPRRWVAKGALGAVAMSLLVATTASASSSPEQAPKIESEPAAEAEQSARAGLPVEFMVAEAEHQAVELFSYIEAAKQEEARKVGEYITALQAIRASDAAAAASRRPVYGGAPANDVLACIRNRESGGDYSIYNSGGSGAAGAYQFMPSTWNSIASSVGRMDLVGVDPAQASPADQDAMAASLYAQQGTAPWGGGC